MIEHKAPECTGNWRYIVTEQPHRLRCDRCREEHPPTGDNRLAAIDENFAGIYLRRLTAEGMAKLKEGQA